MAFDAATPMLHFNIDVVHAESVGLVPGSATQNDGICNRQFLP